MPRLSEAMKDATSCEKLWGGANIRYIRRYPNGVTRHVEGMASFNKKLTRGTETSKYPEEKKTIVIPLVVAIERGRAQTCFVLAKQGL